MQNSSNLHNLIAAALTGVVKQIKAIRYYPPGHPALQASAAESLRSFAPFLSRGHHLALTVRKEGFLLDDNPVAKNNQVLMQLANFCFARRIQHLTFLADLNSRDLHHFVHFLLLDPQIIQKQGGFQRILEKARLTTIWTNIRDLDDILHRKQEIESLPEDPDFDPLGVLAQGDDASADSKSEAVGLETLLAKMEVEENDHRFQHSLQQLIPLLRLQLSIEKRSLVLRAFLLLCRCATGMKYSQERRENANQALEQLTTDEMTVYLLAFLTDELTPQKNRDTLVQVLAFLGDRTVRKSIQSLAGETEVSKRKALSDLVTRVGIRALPVLYEYLVDERWSVVRDIVAILGEIRSQEAITHLIPLLQHDEIRVRRETIRALTKIGGQQAINILMQVAARDDYEMRRQAILSLGAVRATSVVPSLLALLRKSDWSQRAIDLKKDTIRALGEIRSNDAVPALVGIVAKKRWLRRHLNDELRLAAATALGDIADERTRKVLEKVTHDRNAAVARAAAQALKQLDKANP